MRIIRRFWNGNLINKIILVVTTSILGICLCCLGGSVLSSFSVLSPVEPTLGPEALNTAIVETAIALVGQTIVANTPTLVFTSTLAPTITLEPFTETPTFIPLNTPPVIPGTGALPLNTFCVPNSTPQTGKVVHVTDGDTIKVKMDQDGQTYTVRYIGIDTPESTTEVEYFGPEATVKNSELVSGKQVSLYKDVSETDRYDRLLRYVFVGDTFVNHELVRQGYANAARYEPDTACATYFEEAERTAAASSLGMWAAVPLFATPTVVASGPVCSCSGNQYNCSDFGTHTKAQACYSYCVSVGAGDVHKLDGDSNGIACENLP